MKASAGRTQTFAGFSPQALRFLRDLARHNDRAWFAPRKHVYETELVEPLRALVADTSAALRKARLPIGADPMRAPFRIHRDIRFSPDKSPYKTNLGAYLSHDGTRDAPGGLYIHIQPKRSFAAVAFYQIDKPLLLRWRESMARSPKSFEAVLRALERNGLRLSESEDALKRMPRGFEAYAGSPIANYFRLPSFVVSEMLCDDDIADAGLVDRIVALAKRSKPLLDYGWNLE
jgi:uncharacterized protein (TIGR02453 family)